MPSPNPNFLTAEHERRPEVCLAQIPFKALVLEDLFRDTEAFRQVVTVNAEALVLSQEDAHFRSILLQSVTCIDGQVPFWVARKRFAGCPMEKLSGSDIIFDFARFAEANGLRILLLGGYPKSNELTQEKLRTLHPALQISGYSPPFQPFPFPQDHDARIMAEIRAFRPQILFVGFGMPKQEYWIYAHREALAEVGVVWAVGAGGTFELVSGLERRAPRWMQQSGLEGLWRVFQNPSRLRRFLRALKVFKYLRPYPASS